MADAVNPLIPSPGFPGIEQARAMARERFRTRLQAGEPVGGCSCHSEDAEAAARLEGGGETVAGVRFRDSGRTYYFRTGMEDLAPGEWVVAETGRGREAGRVVIAPHQIARGALQGDLTPILRRLDEEDVARMEALRGESAAAVRTCASLARERRLAIKVISAEYAFDGSSLVVNYSIPERDRGLDQGRLRDYAHACADTLDCRIELRQVGPRDEARLLGGVGRCGRTLCCASWLPVYPEISMNMAKTQDLPLNPTKVSGVCGRLLCCLSYENEQYRQMKSAMPRLGQPVDTQAGPGVVVAMQLMRELVTVRLDDGNELVLAPADLGFAADGAPPRPPAALAPAPAPREQAIAAPVAAAVADAAPETPDAEEAPDADSESPRKPSRRRRRRRSGGSSGGQGTPAAPAS